MIVHDLPPPLWPWIDALAKQCAKDYLRAETAHQADHADKRTEPVPLRDTNKAA